MKKKMKFTQEDYLKANRKASREEEIEKHGRPVSFNRIHVSKKVYNRKLRCDTIQFYFYRYFIFNRKNNI